jgi:hypothetical protein
MKHILHDWEDAEASKILGNIRKAIGVQGRLLVVEQVVPPRNEPGLAKIMDLEMLVLPGGRERTEQEWNELLHASRFRMEKVIHTLVPQCIIECVPV